MLEIFIKRLDKPITHIIYVIAIYSILCFFDKISVLNISCTSDKSISVFTIIFSTLITAFTIILAISDKDVIKEIIENEKIWKQLCNISFLPIYYSLAGIILYVINIIIGYSIILEILIITILIINLTLIVLFIYVLKNIFLKLNYNKNNNKIE